MVLNQVNSIKVCYVWHLLARLLTQDELFQEFVYITILDYDCASEYNLHHMLAVIITFQENTLKEWLISERPRTS